MAEYVVGPVADLPPGSHKVIRAGRIDIGVFNVAGTFYALPNICPHQFGPLCTGQVSGTIVAKANTAFRPAWIKEGEIVVCPWHGLEFDITTGRCIAFPNVKLRNYTVTVVEGVVSIIS